MGKAIRRGAQVGMMGSPEQTRCGDDRHWAALAEGLPESLSSLRVLDVGCGAGHDRGAFVQRGAEEVIACKGPSELDPGHREAFGLVSCRGALQSDAHPMHLLARLWHLTAPGGVLLLGSPISEAPGHSRYAHFVPATKATGSAAKWVPGRLTLRWMVEVSGFDVERWFDELPGTSDEFEFATVNAGLRAVRTDRVPAFDLAIPASPQ